LQFTPIHRSTFVFCYVEPNCARVLLLLLQAAAATVLREGHLQQVPAAELVPGDIVELTGVLQM
jgi:magnesium-transporting ATPase (P-type)